LDAVLCPFHAAEIAAASSRLIAEVEMFLAFRDADNEKE
jgi:hypothetical protein